MNQALLWAIIIMQCCLIQPFTAAFHHPARRMTTTFRSTSTQLSAAASSSDVKLVQDILYRIRNVNRQPSVALTDFVVDNVVLGKVTPSMVKKLLPTPVFTLDSGVLTLDESVAGTSCESRTEAVQSVMQDLHNDGTVTGWRDELYPIIDSFYNNADPIFLMERAAVPVLGAIEYGVHMNGLVEGESSTKMWIGRRAPDKSKYPGMLDHIAAGGQPAGLSLMDNALKECGEEAGVFPEDLSTTRGLVPTGAVSYGTYSERNDQMTRSVLFCFDLYLPPGFTPKPVDGEVEEFVLWDMEQVKAAFDPDYPDPIKPNCYIVIADYLIRTGQVNPDTPGYLDVLKELKSGDCR